MAGGTVGEEQEDSEDDARRAAKQKRKRKRKREAQQAELVAIDEERLRRNAESKKARADVSDFTANTVYVEGMPYDTDETAVTEFFAPSCGAIKSVRIARFQDTGRGRGYGHVEFAGRRGVEKALELSGKHMGARYVTVKLAEQPHAFAANKAIAQPLGCRTVFVKNLPYDATEASVTEAFRVCGRVANVRLAMWNHTKALKGFGYVEFEEERAAGIAYNKSGMMVAGRPIKIDYDTGVAKASFKTADGKAWNRQATGKISLGRRGGKGGKGGKGGRGKGGRGGGPRL